jgi:hypothetical protein
LEENEFNSQQSETTDQAFMGWLHSPPQSLWILLKVFEYPINTPLNDKYSLHFLVVSWTVVCHWWMSALTVFRWGV